MIDEKKLIEDIEKEFDGVCVYDVSPSQAVNDFVEIVDRQPKVGEWIPCRERLPEDFEKVLICAYGECEIAYLLGRYWLHGSNSLNRDAVDAWMPLPEPYKKSED